MLASVEVSLIFLSMVLRLEQKDYLRCEVRDSAVGEFNCLQQWAAEAAISAVHPGVSGPGFSDDVNAPAVGNRVPSPGLPGVIESCGHCADGMYLSVRCGEPFEVGERVLHLRESVWADDDL